MQPQPSIGVVLTITNPLSSGYLAYLACIDSWAKVADEVVIVDGWSADGSLDLLSRWIGERPNVRLLHTPMTYWHPGEMFHAHQNGVNLNVGLSDIQTDWVFSINGDYVLNTQTTANLAAQLLEHREDYWLRFQRIKLTGKAQVRLDQRGILINLAKIRRDGLYVAHGQDMRSRIGSDFPIRVVQKATFLDATNGTLKSIFAGQSLPPGGKVDIQCAVYGHFFFTLEQCLAKCRKWDKAFARLYGSAPKRDMEISLAQRFHSIEAHYPKEEILLWGHPLEAQRLIAEFYEPGMLGGAVRRVSSLGQMATNIARKLLGGERHLRTRWMRSQGYRGLDEQHRWVPIDAPDPEPLDVGRAYAEQDRFLGK